MNAYWDSLSIAVGDRLFGWTLSLPRDLTIVVVGVILGMILLGIRWVTTDRALLQQLTADEQRLRELSRQARAAHDDNRLHRIRQLHGALIRRRLSADSLALSISTLVLLVCIPWGDRRLAFLPLDGREPVKVVARFPPAMIGELVHMVPMEDVKSDSGWVRAVTASIDDGGMRGQADWTFSSARPEVVKSIVIRLRNQTVSHRLQIATAKYEQPVQRHEGEIETEVFLLPYRPLGVIPSSIWPGLPGWTIFLSLVAAAVVWAGNRMLRNQLGAPAAP